MKDIAYYMDQPYVVEIRKIPAGEGGGFEASIPFLGGAAFVGDGETEAEAVADLRLVQREIFERKLAEGEAIAEPPSPDTETHSGKFVLRIPPQLHRMIAGSARSAGMSMNAYVQQVLQGHEFRIPRESAAETPGVAEELAVLRGWVERISRDLQALRASRQEHYIHELARLSAVRVGLVSQFSAWNSLLQPTSGFIGQLTVQTSSGSQNWIDETLERVR